MNVLVTGGAGYMGCHTVADLPRESPGHLARWLKYILAFTHLTTEKGMPLREMDKIIDRVSSLCRDHEKAGFVEGIKIGIRLELELAEKAESNSFSKSEHDFFGSPRDFHKEYLKSFLKKRQ